MPKYTKILLFVLSSVMFFSCAENKKEDGNLATLTGVYIYDENFSMLTECTTKKEYWINDVDGKLQEACKKINKDEDKPLYVELRGTLAMPATSGQAAAYENVFDIVEIDFVSEKIKEKCQNMTETGFELYGNTPRKWSLKYEKDFMRFQAFAPDTLMIFPYQEPISDKEGEKIYDITNEGFMHIKFSINEKPCKFDDLILNNHSSWAKVDGLDSFSGCAKVILVTGKD